MKHYVLNVIEPDGDPPPREILDGIMRDVQAVNQAMKDAGVWVFTAGLHAPTASTVVRVKEGQPLITDGPFAEGKEHIGGFSIIEVEDLDVALEWARKLAQATTLPIEVRPVRWGPGR
jgi:hypothetical protein